MSRKENILKELSRLSPEKQEGALGVLENYIRSDIDEAEWDQIPPKWKERIKESIQQIEQGLGSSHDDVMRRIRQKLGLDE